MTALMLAAKFGHRDIVESLIAAGSNVLATVQSREGDGQEKTVLTIALENGYDDIAQLLVAANDGLVAFSDELAARSVRVIITTSHFTI